MQDWLLHRNSAYGFSGARSGETGQQPYPLAEDHRTVPQTSAQGERRMIVRGESNHSDARVQPMRLGPMPIERYHPYYTRPMARAPLNLTDRPEGNNLRSASVPPSREDMPPKATRHRDPRRACIIIDLENLKIGWQKHFRTVFSYFDLCSILNYLERNETIQARRVVLFGTKAESIDSRLDAQVWACVAKRARETDVEEKKKLKRIKACLQAESSSYHKLTRYLREDQSVTKDAKATARIGGPGVSWPARVAAGNNGRTLEFHDFAIIEHEGRWVQRHCDTALVREIVAQGGGNWDTLVLISGDSDFHETMAAESAKRPACEYVTLAPSNCLGAVLRRVIGEKGEGMIVDGVRYLAVEHALPGVNPNAPHCKAPAADGTGMLKRYPIPRGFYADESDLSLGGSNFKAADLRLQLLENNPKSVNRKKRKER